MILRLEKFFQLQSGQNMLSAGRFVEPQCVHFFIMIGVAQYGQNLKLPFISLLQCVHFILDL